MIKEILEKLEGIASYKYDESSASFVAGSFSSVTLIKDIIQIVNVLSENSIQFAIDEKYNINVNIIGAELKKAFVVSLDSKANIVDINDVALEISGYKKDELTGKSFFDIFIDHADKETINKVFLSVLSGSNNYWKYQNNIVLKDGSKKFLHWSNALIKDEKEDISTIHAFGV